MSISSSSPLLDTNRSSINSQPYEAETVRTDLKWGRGIGVFGVLVSIATGLGLKFFHIGSDEAPFWIWGLGGGGFAFFTLKEGYNIRQERVRMQKQKTGMDTHVQKIWNTVIPGMQNLVPDLKVSSTTEGTFQALILAIQTKIQGLESADDTQLEQLQLELESKTNEFASLQKECKDLQGQLSEKKRRCSKRTRK